jgi:hypothetical protein
MPLKLVVDHQLSFTDRLVLVFSADAGIAERVAVHHHQQRHLVGLARGPRRGRAAAGAGG